MSINDISLVMICALTLQIISDIYFCVVSLNCNTFGMTLYFIRQQLFIAITFFVVVTVLQFIGLSFELKNKILLTSEK